MRPRFTSRYFSTPLLTAVAFAAAKLAAVSLACVACATSAPAADGPDAAAAKDSAAKTAAATVQFNRDIRPILSDTCYTCHGPDKVKRATALRFDRQADALADLGGYRAIVPGNREQSVLWKRINSTDADEQMPPPDSGRQLTREQIATLGRWIEQGAKWQKHWSFIPPQRSPLPAVKQPDWARNPIDRFILARLEREGLAPAAEAGKETLIRRVTLDLTGLPPTLAEIDAFLADDSPDAYERVVDRLLASPRYGERMVLEWLDAARYSDTNGYQADATRTMWPWRDWVIGALNRNMPFDEFTIEQIAGDMLPDATLNQKIATAFNRNHMLNGEGGRIPEESRNEYVVDRVETTATVWLGVTLGCARCHDHKYDPFTQKEFYGIYAYFNNVAEDGSLYRRANAKPILEMPTPEQAVRVAEFTERVAEAERQLKAADDKLDMVQPQWELALAAGTAPPAGALAQSGTPPQTSGAGQTSSAAPTTANNPPASSVPAEILALVKTQIAARTPEQTKQVREYYLANSPEHQALAKQLEGAKKSLFDEQLTVLTVMTMGERSEPRETFVLARGQYDKPGEKVSAGVPECLAPLPPGAPNNRLGFARWLVDRSNPLTARVTVNRYWQTFFGTGLVKTSEDFGSQGEPPSNQKLLDWLAARFMTDWDVKAIHRLIVTSATYRQSSRTTPQLQEKDPENRLLARGPRFRMNAHTLRDQALFASGLYVERLGGPSVKPYQPPGIWEDFSFGKIVYQQDHGEKLYRRSIYTFWRRSVGPTMMFDTPARQICTVRQARTNTPLQPLILLNDVTYAEAARVFAERVMRACAGDSAERLQRAFRMLTGRKPREAEQAVLDASFQRLLKQYQANQYAAAKLTSAGEAPVCNDFDAAELAAYTGIASMLMNLDEVLNKE